jgi:Fur family peroxide stress response transcriptional regulator
MLVHYKKSEVRDAILRILRNTRTHPSAEWIWKEVKKDFPSVTLATVYRNLHILERMGEVFSFEANLGERRFDGCVKPHPHFVCTECGKVYDCEGDVGKEMKNMQIPGVVRKVFVTMVGVCDSCLKKIS